MSYVPPHQRTEYGAPPQQHYVAQGGFQAQPHGGYQVTQQQYSAPPQQPQVVAQTQPSYHPHITVGGGGGGGGFTGGYQQNQGGFGGHSGGFGSHGQGGSNQGGGYFGGFGNRSQPVGGYQSHYDPTPQSFKPQVGPSPAGQPHTREEKNMDDLFKDHSSGINFDNYESIEVSVRPNNVKPVDTFEEMALPRSVTDNIRLCNYTKPTPVQKHGIPIVVGGNDLMACAQTGSGKTAAYLIPAVTHALNRTPAPNAGRTAFPICLIMAPTRELTIQIYDEGRKFTYRTGLRCVVVYGGADPRQQIYQLQRGCDILAATPGRLWEMFQRGIVKFSCIKYLVLDEADRMLDMGFEPQIRTIVQGPETDMPAAGVRQTLMYSATFPREIQQLAREFLAREHYFLQVGRVGSTTENITQDLRWVEDSDKRKTLLDILTTNTDKLVLVFVERKRDADYLDRALNQMGLQCTSIHGDRMQREREEALGMFKAGYCRVLVATDVAARGLDIPNVGLVIQFDMPSNLDDYVHRIGRTGRAGKVGTAISFFNEKNKNIVNELSEYLQQHNQNCPDFILALVTRRPQQVSRGRGRGGPGRGRGYFNNRGGSGGFQPQNRGGGGYHHGAGTGYGHSGFQTGNTQNHHNQSYGTSHGNFQSRQPGGFQ